MDDEQIQGLKMEAELVERHFKQLQEMFTTLRLVKLENNKFVIVGNLGFKVTLKDKNIIDDYDIEIYIPDDYPSSPPTVKEVGEKLSRSGHSHINEGYDTLCLGANLAVKKKFAQRINLIWFVCEQVIPLLAFTTYKREHGEIPYEELSSGGEGLVEYYYDFFNTKDIAVVLEYLHMLSSNDYNVHSLCPCGSGMKVKRCHNRLIKKSRRLQKPDQFAQERCQIINYLEKFRIFKNLRPQPVLPETLRFCGYGYND